MRKSRTTRASNVRPISRAIIERDEPDLIESQNPSMASHENTPDQMPTPFFAQAFRDAKKLIPKVEALETKIAGSTSRRLRTRYRTEIRRLNGEFDRLSKHHDVDRAVQAYAATNGGRIGNISECIRYVRQQGVALSIGDRALRTHIKKVFPTEGKRGRPLKGNKL